ncbi:hypothetical protein Pyn_10465 [Prunus yedoensis var. nudiflora]|uniref:Uncharacterized protein n=1 Tax=Prunus yedoensis var. nudiflora TaxID=2094558 RepID=A0A314ZTM9_PRUYE|nr:hypothetical protein Pyn_10465 [Prunus yedoensis var. nudiflora]
MAKSDEGKKMDMPAGSKSGILPYAPISHGPLNAFAGNLFPHHVLKLPAVLHTWTPLLLFVAFVFTQVLSPEAPKRPGTTISRSINGPHDNLLPSIPQPTQASPGHSSDLGPLKLVVRLGVK